MALELATAIVRVKIDRAQLNAEIRSAREAIRKGLSGIKVKVDIDAKQAASSGRRAGKAAGKAAQEEVNRAMSRMFGQSGTGLSTRRGMIVPGRGPEGARFFSQPEPKRIGGPQGGGTGRGIPVVPSGGRGMGFGPPGFFGPGGGASGGGRSRFGGFGGSAKNFGAGALFGMSPGLSVATAFGGPAGAAGYGTAKVATSSIREFASFEHAFKRVEIIQKEAGATKDELEKLEKQARELGRTTVFSALDSARAMVVLTQKGFSANEVYEQMPNVLNLAAAGQLEIASAAGIVASAQKQFGMNSRETLKIVDVLAKASLNSSTDVNELGLSLSYVGNIADLSGKSLQDTVAALMLLRDAGMESSRAGTGLTRVYTKLSESKVVDQFKEIGVSVLDANGSLRSMASVLDDTLKAMQGMSESEKVAFSIEAFGQRGGPAFASLLKQGGDALRENTELLEGFGGTAEMVARESMNDLTGAAIRMKDAWKDLQITFGETFGDGLTTTTETITRAMVDAGKATDSVKGFVGDVTGANSAAKAESLREEGVNLRKRLFERLADDSFPIERQIENLDQAREMNREDIRKAELSGRNPEPFKKKGYELARRQSALRRKLEESKRQDVRDRIDLLDPQHELNNSSAANQRRLRDAAKLSKFKGGASRLMNGLQSLMESGEPGEQSPIEKALERIAVAAPQVLGPLAAAGLSPGIGGTPGLQGAIAGNFQSRTFGVEEMARGIQASLSSRDSTQEQIKNKTAEVAKNTKKTADGIAAIERMRARYS